MSYLKLQDVIPTIILFIVTFMNTSVEVSIYILIDRKVIKSFEDDLKYVNKEVSDILFYHKLLINLPCLVLAFFCASWSERFGKKVILSIVFIGLIISTMFYSLAVHNQHYKLFILLGGGTMGLVGKTYIAGMLLYAHVSAMSEEGTRTSRFAAMAAFSLMGSLLGSLTAGLLISLSDLMWVFIANSVLLIISQILIFLLDDTTSQNATFISINTEAFSQTIRIWRSNQNGRRPVLMVLITILAFNQMVYSGERDVSVPAFKSPPINITDSQFSIIYTSEGVTKAIGSLLILPALSKLLGFSDSFLIIFGMIMKGVQYTYLSFNYNFQMLIGFVPLGFANAFIGVCSKAALTKSVNEDEVSFILAQMVCFEAILAPIGSLLSLKIYSFTSNVYPIIIFLINGAAHFFCIPIAVIYHFFSRRVGNTEECYPFA